MSERDPLDALARELFEAARRERPSPEARERTREHAVPLRSAATGVPFRSDAPERRAWDQRRVAALAVAGLGALAVAAAVVIAVTPPQRAGTREVVSIRRETLDSVPVTAGRNSKSDLAAPLTQEPPQAVSASAPDAAPRRVRAQQTRPVTLADEVAALDRARAALGANDGRRALQLLDGYERKLRGTRLQAEATLLRIEALARTGQAAHAGQLAQRFIADYPGSPLADRARALVGSAPGTNDGGVP